MQCNQTPAEELLGFKNSQYDQVPRIFCQRNLLRHTCLKVWCRNLRMPV